MKLSACWIVKDEAEALRRSLESVKEGVDELVVVDTGGTDAVGEVARALEARLVPFTWVNDFAAARNFALAQVPGAQVVLFLDADEWFDPPFGPEQRGLVEQLLEANPHLDVLEVVRNDVDMVSGLVMVSARSVRFLNMSGGNIHYEGAIHERVVLKSGGIPRSAQLALTMNHSGYSNDVIEGKVARNLALLEQEYADPDLDAERNRMVLAYLIREYSSQNNQPKLEYYICRMMDTPDFFRQLEYLSEVPLTVALEAVKGAAAGRSRFSRREVFDKVVLRAEKVFGDDVAYKLPRMLYYRLFDLSEERFMEALPAQFPTKDCLALVQGERQFMFLQLPSLYGWMARMRWNYGDVVGAFDYATNAFVQTDSYLDTDVLVILLNCMHGQPEADQVLLLENLFGTANDTTLRWLAGALNLLGNNLVHLFYYKKAVDRGVANKADYFYVQLAQGKYDDMRASLEQARAGTDPGLVDDLEMLCMLCSGAGAPGGLAPVNTAIVEAFSRGAQLAEVPAEALQKLYNYYGILAAIDYGMAERYRAVFGAARREVFLHKAEYCLLMGFYDRMLNEPMAGLEADVACCRAMAVCYCRMGMHAQALPLLQGVWREGMFSADWMSALLMVARQAQGETGAQAGALYDELLARADELCELQDVAATGVAYDDVSKKQARALARVTQEQLDESIRKDALPVDQALHWQIMRQAAAVYEEKRMYGMAERCYSRMATAPFAGRATWEGLARAYERLGNAALATQLRQRAEGCEPERLD